jgi:ubiquinone biosynthesis protein Coq4
MSENYLDRDCQITLRQALNRYYAQNPGFYQPNQLDADSKQVFFSHDVCHIVFGCDTSLVGEVKLALWVLNSTNLRSENQLNRALRAEATKKAHAAVSPVQVIGQAISHSPMLVRAYRMAKKVEPSWDFLDYGNYLDRSVLDIRREFNIQIV